MYILQSQLIGACGRVSISHNALSKQRSPNAVDGENGAVIIFLLHAYIPRSATASPR